MALTWFFGLTLTETFDGLRTYVESVDAALVSIERRQSRRLEKELGDLETEEADHRRYIHEELYRGQLPENFHFSCVLLLVARIEALSATLCDDLAKRLHVRRPQKRELKQPGKMRAYLQSLVGLPLSKHPFERSLEALRTVRNCIAHTGGQLRGFNNPTGLRTAVKRLGFDLRSDGVVMIDRTALREVIDAGDEWLGLLYSLAYVRMRDDDLVR